MLFFLLIYSSIVIETFLFACILKTGGMKNGFNILRVQAHKKK